MKELKGAILSQNQLKGAILSQNHWQSQGVAQGDRAPSIKMPPMTQI